jgi:hypothetical protein
MATSSNWWQAHGEKAAQDLATGVKGLNVKTPARTLRMLY